MGLSDIVKQLSGGEEQERLVSVDIGTSTIKLMELDVLGVKPKLVNAGMAPSPAGAVKNHTVTSPEEVAKVIRSILDANAFESSKAVAAIPGPSVFTKKATVGFTNIKELDANLSFEASNYIPHNIENVHLDYQVLKKNSNSSMDVLLVAVKNEIVQSYVEAIQLAGLEAAVADVDYFALANMFNICYPEECEKTVALVDIGARYTGINIIVNGESVFTGDVAVGGRLYTDALCETLDIKPIEAEAAKMGSLPEGVEQSLVDETLEQTTEHVASELHRQLGFFWNAAATDQQIDTIYVGGGASQMSGFMEELSAKTGLLCNHLDPFRGIDCSSGFDVEYLKEISPSMVVSVGLASRRLGDKVHAADQ